jgi:hypothetical protein
MDVTGTDRGTGGGWITYSAQFASTGSPQAQYDQCYGGDIPDDMTTCSASDDPQAFSIPASGNWKRKERNAPAIGFADPNGKAVLRVYFSRAEQVHSAPNVHHLVSAEECGAYVCITNRGEACSIPPKEECTSK